MVTTSTTLCACETTRLHRSCFQLLDLLPLVVDYLSGQLFAPLGFLQFFAVIGDFLFYVLLGKLDGSTARRAVDASTIHSRPSISSERLLINSSARLLFIIKTLFVVSCSKSVSFLRFGYNQGSTHYRDNVGSVSWQQQR